MIRFARRPARARAAAVFACLALVAAGADAKGPLPPLEVAIVASPAGVDALGTPFGVVVDRRDGLPTSATDSNSVVVPAGQQLLIDQVGAFATFDRDLPAGIRFPLFLTGGGVQMPIGFGEVTGNEIHFAIPFAMLLRGNFAFAIVGDFGGANVLFARYSVAGRLVPAR